LDKDWTSPGWRPSSDKDFGNMELGEALDPTTQQFGPKLTPEKITELLGKIDDVLNLVYENFSIRATNFVDIVTQWISRTRSLETLREIQQIFTNNLDLEFKKYVATLRSMGSLNITSHVINAADRWENIDLFLETLTPEEAHTVLTYLIEAKEITEFYAIEGYKKIRAPELLQSLVARHLISLVPLEEALRKIVQTRKTKSIREEVGHPETREPLPASESVEHILMSLGWIHKFYMTAESATKEQIQNRMEQQVDRVERLHQSTITEMQSKAAAKQKAILFGTV